MKKVIILVFFLLSFLDNTTARAQEIAGLKIQPSIIEEKVEPGQVFTSTLRATNLGSEIGVFYVIKRNISGLSSSGFPIFAGEEEKTGWEIDSWIKITSEPIIIAPGETRAIPLTIAIPKTATPGGHFGGIFLATSPELPTETGAAIGYQVATIINLRIAGDILEEAQIREFRTDQEIYGRPEVKFLVKVANLGNVLVRPRGPVEITDWFGKKVATLLLNESGAAVLPKAIRQFETSWQGERLSFGRYQAVLTLAFGEEGVKSLNSSLSFWVLPLNIILPIAGGLLGLILIILVFVKLHIRKKLRELGRSTEQAVHHSSLAPLERELLHHQKGAPLSRAALVTVVLLIFTLVFLLVLFFFFA